MPRRRLYTPPEPRVIAIAVAKTHPLSWLKGWEPALIAALLSGSVFALLA